MRTWIRRSEEPILPGSDVLVWVQDDRGLYYVLLDSGVFKLASMVAYEGMTWDWEPDERSFLELKDAK